MCDSCTGMIRTRVEKYGVTFAIGDDMGHSIGLTDFGQPEILVRGVADKAVLHWVLSAVAARLAVSPQNRATDGTSVILTDVNDTDVVFRARTVNGRTARAANHHYGRVVDLVEFRTMADLSTIVSPPPNS